MQVDKTTAQARKRMVEHWTQARGALQRMRQNAKVKPDDGWQTFEPTGSTGEFTIRPFVLNLPERANHRDCRLFVVVEGRLALSDDTPREDVLITRSFATRVAYFRQTKEGLDHVYGAHFDFSQNELGHPIFHCQVTSMAAQRSHIKDLYRIEVDGNDSLVNVLGTVRIPTAQMDVFSLFLQVCADHLLVKDSGGTEQSAFNDLLQASAFLRGAGAQSAGLIAEAAQRCYRARHWYPVLNTAEKPAAKGSGSARKP